MHLNSRYSIHNTLLYNHFNLNTLLAESIYNEILCSYTSYSDTPSSNKVAHWTVANVGGKYKLSSRFIQYDKCFKNIFAFSNEVITDYFLSMYQQHRTLTKAMHPSHFLSVDAGYTILKKILNIKHINNPFACDLSKIYKHPRYRHIKEAAHIYINKGVIPVVPSFHLSCMMPNTTIVPHTDGNTKVVSIMLYLPSQSQKNYPGLGTIFWSPKESTNLILDSSGQLGYEKLNELKLYEKYDPIEAPYTDSNVVIFYKTDQSWHSFRYPSCDLGPRLSLNINLHTLVELT